MAALLRSRRALLSAVSVGGALTYLANDVDSAIARSLRVARHALIVDLDYKFGPASKLPADTEAYKAAMRKHSALRRAHAWCLPPTRRALREAWSIHLIDELCTSPAYPTVMSACQTARPRWTSTPFARRSSMSWVAASRTSSKALSTSRLLRPRWHRF